MRGAAARKSSGRNEGAKEVIGKDRSALLKAAPLKSVKKPTKISSAAAKQRREKHLSAITIEEKIHFILHSGVSSEEDTFTLHSGKNKLRIDELFHRAVSGAADMAKLHFANAEEEIVKVRRIDRRIKDLEPELRSTYAAERFEASLAKSTAEIKLLQKDPRAAAMKMIEIVKRLTKSLERNHLTFLDVKHPSVFVFSSGRITVSSYRAVEKKWGKEAQKEEALPLPPIESLSVDSVEDLQLLLDTAVPMPPVAEQAEKEMA